MSRVRLEPGAPRLSVFTCIQTLIGFGIVALFIEFDLSTVRLWPTAAFALVTYLPAVFYDVSENRRVSPSMEGLLFLPALFVLGPMEVIIGRVVGGHFSSILKFGTPYKVWFNTSTQFMVIAATVALIELIDPNRSLATVTVQEAAFMGMASLALYAALVPVWTITFSIGNFGRIQRKVLLDSLSTQVIVVVEFALGMLVVMALATSSWMFAPVIVITALLVYLSVRSARHWVLRAGMDHILDLARSASRTPDCDETFQAVRRSVEKLGAVEDAVIAHIDQDDKVSFDPPPGFVIGREASSGSKLRALARQGSFSTSARATKAGTVGVWKLSETTDDYLIAHCDRRMVSLRNFWQTVDILSQHAALIHRTTNQRRALEQRARTDETTGLPNRIALLERLETGIAGDEPMVVVTLRVHGLVGLQQVLGEEAANSGLRTFVHHLRALQGFEFVARVRDDVFALVSPGPIVETIEAARRIVSTGQHRADTVRAVAAGVVEVDRAKTERAEELLSHCSVTLARAERDDLKVAQFDDRDAEAARRRFAIGKALPEAIEQGQIFPVFQPQVSIATGELKGCEVLARWVHPELGFVSPLEFIEVAEQGNMIEPLTDCMLAAACAARARWMELGINVQFSVNISARSLLQPAFIEHIADLFERAGLRDDELTVEITESTIAEDDSTTAESLELLHRIGATISIDDFGTGYSALAYLHRLPVDEVKIDKSMVMALGQERDPTDVVAGLIAICQRLGIRVVAEGVETSEALTRLEALGCDIAQGYFFAKPMIEKEWCAWALEWSRGRPLRRGREPPSHRYHDVPVGVTDGSDTPGVSRW